MQSLVGYAKEEQQGRLGEMGTNDGAMHRKLVIKPEHRKDHPSH